MCLALRMNLTSGRVQWLPTFQVAHNVLGRFVWCVLPFPPQIMWYPLQTKKAIYVENYWKPLDIFSFFYNGLVAGKSKKEAATFDIKFVHELSSSAYVHEAHKTQFERA